MTLQIALVAVAVAFAAFPADAQVQLPPPPPGVQVTTQYGFQFSTITAPNNVGFNLSVLPGTGIDLSGRGSVSYSYRISRDEISTAQWADFVNTFSTQANFPSTMFGSTSFTAGFYLWGAGQDSSYTGPGVRFSYSSADGARPVFDITWRQAAMYCNWITNGKSSNPSSLLNGAYDTSTWNNAPASSYTDSATHEPGAAVWIPTQDEWMKAAGYDPNRYGLGQGGWWSYLDSRNAPPVSGFPGDPGATSSAGLDFNATNSAGVYPYEIPLAAYPNSQSPWGLLDTSSGGSEFTEEQFYPGQLQERGVAGTYAGEPDFIIPLTAQIGSLQSGAIVGFGSRSSFRLASAVPSPGMSASFLLLLAGGSRHRGQRNPYAAKQGRRQLPSHTIADSLAEQAR